MDSQRASFKRWNGNENVISEEIERHRVDNGLCKQGDWRQSCIFDPVAFTDSSSTTSVSGESCESYDLTEQDSDQGDSHSPELSKYERGSCPNGITKLDIKEGPPLQHCNNNGVLPYRVYSRLLLDRPVESSSIEPLPSGMECQGSDGFSDSGTEIEPYSASKLTEANDLIDISEQHTEDNKTQNDELSILSKTGSFHIDDGSSGEIVRSILKRDIPMNKVSSRRKKKVRFDLNEYEMSCDGDKSTVEKEKNRKNKKMIEISSSLNPTVINCITRKNTKLIYSSIENLNTYTKTVVTEKTAEEATNILNKMKEFHIQSNQENSKSKAIDKLKEEFISFDPEHKSTQHYPATTNDNLKKLEKHSINGLNCSLEKSDFGHKREEEMEGMQSEEANKTFRSDGSSSVVLYETLEESTSSDLIGIRSDFDQDTSAKEENFSNVKNVPKQLPTRNQVILEENEYSSFIRDLVTGSGDKLTTFLKELKSEISKEGRQEKLYTALEKSLIAQQEIAESERPLEVKNAEKKLEDVYEYRKMAVIKSKSLQNLDRNTEVIFETQALDDCQENESVVKNGEKKSFLINARKSKSEVNVPKLHPRASCRNNFMENRLHTSNINRRNACAEWDGPLINNYGNKTDKMVEKLQELMSQLRESIEKINKKESTIHVENAQIWLNSSKSGERIQSSNQDQTNVRKVISISEEVGLTSQSNKTRETYSQTLTADINLTDYFAKIVSKIPENRTEIHIHSNNRNEEINIKVNDKKIKIKDSVLAMESKENQLTYFPTGQINSLETESEEEKRSSFFYDDSDLFNIVLDDETKLPKLKRGKYEFEIFEHTDEPVITENSFKNIIKKIKDQMPSLKLNGLQNYQKPSSRCQKHSSKLKTIQNHTEEKPVGGNIFQSFLNKFSNSNNNASSSKNSGTGGKNSKQFLDLKNQLGILSSIFPTGGKRNGYQGGCDAKPNLQKVNVYKSEQFTKKTVECNHDGISAGDDDVQWPDIIKTKYPNGMVHFGPLDRMPEPSTIMNRQSMDWDSCSYPCFTEYHQYSYNRQTSVTRNISKKAKTVMSLGEFTEMEQKIYRRWSPIEK